MKYSQLKKELVDAEIKITANKWGISFNTSSRSVKMYWSEEELKANKKNWVAIVSSNDFPLVKKDKDAEITEIKVYIEEGLLSMILSSLEEVFIPCTFVNQNKTSSSSSEPLIWSTYSLSEKDLKWLRQHTKAYKMALENYGSCINMMAMYAESGLMSVRLMNAETSKELPERVTFSTEGIPFKKIKGYVTIFRFKNSIEFSCNRGREIINYRVPLLKEEPGEQIPYDFAVPGHSTFCSPNTGKLLKDLLQASREANKTSVLVRIKDGGVEIGSTVCLAGEYTHLSASVLIPLKIANKLVEFLPVKFPEEIWITFPRQLNGVTKKAEKIPECLVITYPFDGDESEEERVNGYPRNRFILKCRVKILLHIDQKIIDEYDMKETFEVVEETAEKAVEILDAIASKIASDPSLFWGDITPEFIQEKKEEIQKIAKALAPLKRGEDLTTFRAKKLVLQAEDGLGRILDIIYEIETSALSRGILLDFFGEPVSPTKTEIKAEVEEDINKLGQFVTDVVKAIQDPATEHIKWTLEQIQKTLEALEAGLKVSSKAVGDTTQEITNILNGITETSEQFVKQLLQQIINYWNEYWKERILECILSMGLAEKALTIVSKIKRNYPNFSSNQIAQNVINEKLLYSLITGMVGAIPGATLLVDLSVTTPLLIQMVYEIACAYEQDIKSPELTQEILAILCLTLTVDNLPKMGLGFLLKHTPIASWAINPIINATLFLGVGYAACQYYEVKLSGKDPLSAETYQELIAEVNSYFSQLTTEGQKVQEIVNKAIALKDKLPAAT